MKIDIKTRVDYQKLLQLTIKETLVRLEDFPEMAIYMTVYTDLYDIDNILFVEKRLPTFVETRVLSIGGIAVKNFKEEDPDYADKLMLLFHYFQNYSTLSIK